ncbi:hypothetical protein [Nitrospira sp. KM1]|uniref:hypothetical protein n=1 Tax=Nitrospira sp. KM1 TaxID=1936990 RepID=UPI0015667E05|nr:hypothetical protein [Nitrospira sp. KM1]
MPHFSTDSKIAGQIPMSWPGAGCRDERRQERREFFFERCTYEMVEASGDTAISHKMGEAYAINRSSGGMLLLMTQAPKSRQYLEILTTETLGRKAISVCEVSWTQPIHIESKGDYFMVGCHRILAPCRYLEF